MIKLFFMNLWSNIKRSPIVSLLLFLQIALLSYCLMSILFSQAQSDVTNDAYQGVYANYVTYSIRSYNLSREEFARASAGEFESLENTGLDVYEAFHEKMTESQDIYTAMMLQHGTADDIYSVDQNYFDFFNLLLDSGRFFTESEYNEIDPECVPAILGSDYKEKYSLGDTFQSTVNIFGASDNERMTYKVVGFLLEGQLFFTPGGMGPYSFNDKILLPYVSKSLEEWLDCYEQNEEYMTKKQVIRYYIAGLGANMLSGRHYMIETGKEAVLKEYMQTALKETGLNEFYKIGTVKRAAMQTGDELAEKNAILTSLVLIMVVFSITSIVFSAVNNVSENMKTNAVHNLVGATQFQIITYTIIEVFLYCILGFFCGFSWSYVNRLLQNDMAEQIMSIAIKNLLITGAAFTVIACVLSYIFVLIKVRSYSISELIRGREIRKDKRQPIYKVMFFVMLLFVSICITFLNSYNYQIDHIDKYQNNYWASNVNVIYLQELNQENAPAVELFYKLDGVENYSVDLCLRTDYDEMEGPKIRGWYYKGDFGVPEITEGRFFTEEETETACEYAVVGKNVLEDFVEERDGKRFFTYNDQEFEVIGIVGREGHDTTLDDWVFLPLQTVLERYGCNGRPVVIDGKTDAERIAVTDNIKAMANGRYTYMEYTMQSRIDIGISKGIVNIFTVLIFITTVVFCLYYIDKIKGIINIKKFIGFSKAAIFADTAALFALLSTAAFFIGNAVFWICSKTLLKNTTFFSVFEINLPILGLSYALLLVISLFFSLLAINKSFRGSARDLKIR